MRLQSIFKDKNTGAEEVVHALAEESPIEEASRIIEAICNVAYSEGKICHHLLVLGNDDPVRGRDISGKVLSEYITVLSKEIASKKSISYMMVNGV